MVDGFPVGKGADVGAGPILGRAARAALDLADAIIGDRDDPLVGFLAVREEFGLGGQWNRRHLSRDRRFGCRQPVVTPMHAERFGDFAGGRPSLSKRSAIRVASP